MKNGIQVKTRLAPSPTGMLHVGTARTALFNYLFARRHGGMFFVRVEDTDKMRSKPEYELNILNGLTALCLDNDGVSRQSENLPRHSAELGRLIAEGCAYVSNEPSKDDPARTVEVVRLKNTGKIITFHDEVRGDITFDTTELGDFVIARSVTDPLFHFAVVVDDHDMGITHVIRGEDHVSNTPRQILIQDALGYPRPTYVHIPLILATDRSKLSKRRGAVAVSEYLDEGYLPEALINFLALLGWNPGTEQELFSKEELVQCFDLGGLQKGGAVFDIERLKWMNREHMKRRDFSIVLEDVSARLGRRAIVETLRVGEEVLRDAIERYSTYGEFVRAVEEGEFSFYETRPEYDTALLLFKKTQDAGEAREHLTQVKRLVEGLLEPLRHEDVRSAVWPYAEEYGRGNVLWPMRCALSGKERSPDPFLLCEALGKTEALARFEAALTRLALFAPHTS